MKKIIILIALAGAVITGIIIFTRTDKKITAEERIVMEMEHVENLSRFVEQADNVTAAYSAAEMDKDAYIERNNVLKNEFYILKNSFSVWQEEHPVKTGTETEITKRGEQAIINMQNDIDTLLDCTFNEGVPYDIYQLYYRYMLQKDKVKADSIDFIIAYRCINEKADFNELVEQYKTEGNDGDKVH